MPTYSEVLGQAKNLTVSEQRQLLKELTSLVSQQESSRSEKKFSELLEKNKWRGFLPQRVDALEFQFSLRREWDE
ncbi:MAG: hypothetical protein F6K35_47720 [Okeania sp. SIO2H7]|nr:hypothetical protein [Okeania sp. SIO2H7]